MVRTPDEPLRQRPDLAVVVEPLRAFGCCRASLPTPYPNLLPIDAGAEDWRGALRLTGRSVCEARIDGATVLNCSAA